MEVTQVDRFEPDWEGVCICCGTSPTVTAVANGKVVYAGEMCGACTWGDADLVHPFNWDRDD